MKRVYVKPSLYAETFALAEHITNCSPMGRANHQSAATCGYDTGSAGYAFLESAAGKCNYDPFEGELDSGAITGHELHDCAGDNFQADAVVFSS